MYSAVAAETYSGADSALYDIVESPVFKRCQDVIRIENIIELSVKRRTGNGYGVSEGFYAVKRVEKLLFGIIGTRRRISPQPMSART